MPQPAVGQRPQISAFQFGMLVAGITSISNHALAVTYLLQAGGRDAWIGGLVGLLPAGLAIAALISLSRAFPGRSLVQYLPRLLGPGLGHAVAVMYIVYFLLGTIFTLRRTSDWLVDTLLPETPMVVITGLYLLACLYIGAGGIETLARANQYTLPILTALGIFVSLTTMPDKDYQLLFPILERGMGPAIQATYAAMGILGEMSILGMFVHRVSDRERVLRAGLIGALYAVLTMTGPLSGAIAALGYRQGANMPYPTFQQWLLVSFARFVERTDLMAVHQWLVGAYVRTGLQFYCAAIGTWELLGGGKWVWYLLGGGLAVWVGALAPFRTILSFDAFVTGLYLPSGAILGLGVPVLLWLVAAARGLLRKGVKKGGQAPGA